MKNFISLVAALFLFLPNWTQAQNYGSRKRNLNSGDQNFYLEILGGANFLKSDTNGGIQSEYKTGYLASASLGYRFCYGLRFEAEYAYRRNSLKNVHFFGRTFSLNGHFQSSSYMANILWDLPLSYLGCTSWDLKPFMGGGIGYGCQKIHGGSDGLTFNERKKGFSWQWMAGLTYPYYCNMDLSLEYKFHKGGFNYIRSHSVGVGLVYKFSLS